MGRWTQYDEDENRLPEGMKRTGYDADTGRYYFQDRDGSIWQGAEGAEFSEMTRVSGPSESSATDDHQEGDIEAAPTRADGYQPISTEPTRGPMAYQSDNNGAYRTLFPFFLIIAVVLLLVWRLILSPGISSPTNVCPKRTTGYWVEPGDSCWDISKAHGCSLEEFKELNQKVDCSALMPGTTVCLPNVPRTTPS
ncbi:hypothetical protein Hypma_013425 [Hypsizygus marmoreus]|uniref:LysM domain-containing protein n=1 Tax=Hypsizygus marmoreus TaxID=39966 RepID=A0A369JB84_HYPMA|nr:hypothetical protein Hypma_013425 [Hypsizygus marmoreus]